MKNLTILITPEDIHRYVRGLFRTDDFRQSYDHGGLVHQVVARFAALPKFYYEATDKYREHGHFTSWWGGMQLRPDDYELAAVHDLYIFHEMIHAGTMPVHPDLQYETFMQILGDNEADASVMSEIAAYFDMPGLRAKSFTFPIYADRFLDNPVYQAWWKNHQDDFLQSMKYTRRNLMHPDYVPQDSPETWIHNFAAQNTALGPIWKDRVTDVERMIWDFRTGCRDTAIGPAKAMQRQLDYLMSEEITGGTDIPFVREARAAAPIIWANKNSYAASLKPVLPAGIPATPKPPAP